MNRTRRSPSQDSEPSVQAPAQDSGGSNQAAVDEIAAGGVDEDLPFLSAAAEEVDDVTWASDRRQAIRELRAQLHAHATWLNEDAASALVVLRATNTAFDAYEERYVSAKEHFEKEISDYLEFAQQKRDNLNFIIGLALGGLEGKLVIDVVTKALDTVGKIEDTAALFKPRGHVGSEPAEAEAPSGMEVDWRALVDVAMDTFSGYLSQTSELTKVRGSCDGLEELLDGVVEGTVPPLAGRHSPTGAIVDFYAARSGAISEALAGSGGVASAAQGLYDELVPPLDAMGGLDLEREMAMGWIAEMDRTQLSAIGDVGPYLEQIGVLGEGSSGVGLNIDTGSISCDHEERMVFVRAQIRALAQESVGREASWLGGTAMFGSVAGKIEIDGQTFRASGGPSEPVGKCGDVGSYLPEESGGWVRITGFRFDEMFLVEETSDWSGTNEKDYRAQMMGAISFDVAPTRGTVPGAMGIFQGPSMSAG